LRQTLEKRKSVALSGFGGFAKTQTVIEYAYRHRALYTAVFWAKAESREQLLGDFASIARMLNLPSSQAKEQEVTVAEVKHFLETHTGWLLILDNADDLDLAREFLPHDAQGHLPLTTRAHALGGLAERLSIGEMQPEEGALCCSVVRCSLASDAIPEEVFTEGAAVLGDHLGGVAGSSLEFAKVLKEAGRFSLIDRDAQARTRAVSNSEALTILSR
jgi:hypothetical protein